MFILFLQYGIIIKVVQSACNYYKMVKKNYFVKLIKKSNQTLANDYLQIATASLQQPQFGAPIKDFIT